MFFKTLDRYILKEIFSPFIIIMIVLTLGITSGNMIKLSDFVLNKGIGILVILKLFMYLLPYLISFTAPLAFLTSILLAFGKLSQDNEIIALKASGISIYKLIRPVIFTSILISFLNLYMNNSIVTNAHFKLRMLFFDIGYEKIESLIEPGKFINTFNNYIIYIKDVNNKELNQIIIYEIEHEKTVRTITAKKGIIEKSADGKKIIFRLYDGSAEEPDPKNPNKFYKLYFKSFPITLAIEDNDRITKLQNKRLKELSLNEIKHKIKEINGKDLFANRLKTEFHRKITFSFACLVLTLIGLPLAIYAKRGEKSLGFGISLILAFVYYILNMFTISICEQGYINPSYGMWIPNIILGIIGIFMLTKVCKQ